MLLRVKDVVRLLNISRPTLYNWVSERKIPHHNINGRIRFDEVEIRSWIAERRVAAR
jgi:excisionase family DNA binding protein